jgi:hypothetical protein
MDLQAARRSAGTTGAKSDRDMPRLQENATTGDLNCRGDSLPAFHLFTLFTGEGKSEPLRAHHDF